MRKNKQEVRYHVLSVRVSREERETIEKLSRQSNMKISELMREALQAVVPWHPSPEQIIHR